MNSRKHSISMTLSEHPLDYALLCKAFLSSNSTHLIAMADGRCGRLCIMFQTAT